MMSWQYIAGFFDGEGTIPVRNNHGLIPKPSIVQTGEVGILLLNLIKNFLESKGIKSSVYEDVRGGNNVKSHWKKIHMLHVTNNESSILFLKGISPFVHIKKVAVHDVIRFAKLFPGLKGFHNGILGRHDSPRAIASRRWRMLNPDKHRELQQRAYAKRKRMLSQ
jgi:hypothetical protein